MPVSAPESGEREATFRDADTNPEEQRGKREQILDAALTAFCRQGYHATKIEDIARAAGVGKGTFYLYFASKEAVLLEITQRSVSQLLAAMRKIIDGPGRVRDKLHRLAAFSLQFAERNGRMAQVNLEGVGELKAPMRAWLVDREREILSMLRGLVESGQRSGELVDADPDLIVACILGGVRSLTMAILAGLRPPAAEETGASLMSILWNGIGAR